MGVFESFVERWSIGLIILVVSGLFGIAFVELLKVVFAFFDLDLNFVAGLFLYFVLISWFAWFIGVVVLYNLKLKREKRHG